jgi:hypothetical protein
LSGIARSIRAESLEIPGKGEPARMLSMRAASGADEGWLQLQEHLANGKITESREYMDTHLVKAAFGQPGGTKKIRLEWPNVIAPR